MVEIARFRKLMRKHGYFVTQARLNLFRTLLNRPTLTMKELISLLPQHDQSTAYRNILLFEQLGVITRLRLGWHSRVELSDTFRHHHHHFTCVNCGKIYDLPEDKAIEQEILKIGQSIGAKIMDHQLEIKGICKSCRHNISS